MISDKSKWIILSNTQCMAWWYNEDMSQASGFNCKQKPRQEECVNKIRKRHLGPIVFCHQWCCWVKFRRPHFFRFDRRIPAMNDDDETSFCWLSYDCLAGPKLYGCWVRPFEWKTWNISFFGLKGQKGHFWCILNKPIDRDETLLAHNFRSV